MGKNLLSLGAIAMDIVLNTNQLPEDDGFSFITNEVTLPGGSASNVSVSASNLGLNVFQTGKIGDDELGREFLKTLEEDGVDSRHVVVKKQGTTLHTYIIVVPGGKHCIFANTGDTVTTLLPTELEDDIMDEMDIFYTDMFSSKAALWLAKKAKEQNKPILYNMQCVPSFMAQCGTSEDEIRQMIGMSTVFVSGPDGYYELTGETDYRKAMRTIYNKYKVEDGVICTNGKEGSVWFDGDEYFMPAYIIEPVDTTGAGDCFLGGLLYAYFQEGMEKSEALRFANASAAIKCLNAGPRSRASVREINEFKEHKMKL